MFLTAFRTPLTPRRRFAVPSPINISTNKQKSLSFFILPLMKSLGTTFAIENEYPYLSSFSISVTVPLYTTFGFIFGKFPFTLIFFHILFKYSCTSIVSVKTLAIVKLSLLNTFLSNFISISIGVSRVIVFFAIISHPISILFILYLHFYKMSNKTYNKNT